MALTSMEFLILVGIAVAGYYLIPKKYQWMWLLGFSYLYYVSGGVKLLGYLLFTTLTTYGAGIFLEKTEEKGRRKGILILTLVLNFGVLAVLKYLNFVLLNINRIFQGDISFCQFCAAAGNFLLYVSIHGISSGCVLEERKGRKKSFPVCAVCSFLSSAFAGPHRTFFTAG